jgi:hypothetical protein
MLVERGTTGRDSGRFRRTTSSSPGSPATDFVGRASTTGCGPDDEGALQPGMLDPGLCGVRIWTSYWGNRDLAHVGAVKACISRGRPKWSLPYRFRVLSDLAPSREAFKAPDGEWQRIYRLQLEELGAQRILEDLERISNGHGVIMLCWERPEPGNDFCHRRVLAAWLEEQLGIEVPELLGGELRHHAPHHEDEPKLF